LIAAAIGWAAWCCKLRENQEVDDALKQSRCFERFVGLEVSLTGMVSVMVAETDLHLNVRHPQHDGPAVSNLLLDVRKYLETSGDQVTKIRIVSVCHEQM
jgi:hypothetical protein